MFYRNIVFNKSVFGSYLKIPKNGSFVANITQGGCKVMFRKNDIPKKALSITKEVINAFNSLPVDYIKDKKWYEENTQMDRHWAYRKEFMNDDMTELKGEE